MYKLSVLFSLFQQQPKRMRISFILVSVDRIFDLISEVKNNCVTEQFLQQPKLYLKKNGTNLYLQIDNRIAGKIWTSTSWSLVIRIVMGMDFQIKSQRYHFLKYSEVILCLYIRWNFNITLCLLTHHFCLLINSLCLNKGELLSYISTKLAIYKVSHSEWSTFRFIRLPLSTSCVQKLLGHITTNNFGWCGSVPVS